MKRNRSTSFGILAISAMVLSACAGNADGDANTIDLWLPPQADIANASEWDPILADFEAERGVDVRVRIIPWESYEEAFLAGVSGGEGPDVGLMYSEMMGEYLAQGAIVPFDDYLPGSDAPEYLYLDQGQVDGEQVAIPLVVGGARVMYYNADLLAQAGIEEPPSTWEEFLQACEQLLEAGITPFQQPWGHHNGMLNEHFYPFLWQAGGQMYTEDGTATAFNSPEGLAAAEFLMQLRESEIVTDASTSLIDVDVETEFTSGQSAFMFSSDANYANYDENDFELGFIDSLEETRRGTFVAADSLVMLEQCPDKQLCTDLVTYITSPDQMAQFHEIAPYPPLTEGAEYVAPDIFEDLYAEEDILHNLPVAAGSSAASNALHRNLQQMILGQKTPEEALADAAHEGDLALENAQR
ncbi:MAG TPA: extracellular solute-binding protein [Beutenbergiaceae bacterium]|nr:extracellular solute-binding protein [Beutenbergiaceae bacterium]